MKQQVILANLKDQVYEILKQNILSGAYLPGTRLVIDNLAEEYNVSRTPIRDVLHSLISKGLIDQKGKGYQVFNPSLSEVRDISSLRLELEKMAVEQCTLRCSDQELKKLETFKKIDLEHLNNITLEEYDVSFHDEILKYTRNKHLTFHLHMVRDLWWLIRRWTKAETSEEVKIISISQHLEIIDKIIERDVEGAKEFMEKHHNRGLSDILNSSLFK